MPHAKGKDHWMNRRQIIANDFYTSVGAISAMIVDLKPEDLKSVVDWGQHILKTRPKWYRRKFDANSQVDSGK